MDIAGLTQLIGSVGFPIAMCIMMALYIKNEQDTTRKTLEDLSTAIKMMTQELRASKKDGDKYDI